MVLLKGSGHIKNSKTKKGSNKKIEKSEIKIKNNNFIFF